MFVLLVTLSLASNAFGALLCPSSFSPEVTVHIAHPTDCGKFLTCVGSQPVEQYCPVGLHWNEQDSYCDYPGRSRCSRNLSPDHPRFNVSALSSSVCLPAASRCPLNSKPQEEVVFLKHQNCKKFYACVSAQPVELSCPLNLYWNSKSCSCDYEVEEECGQLGKRPEEPSEEVDGNAGAGGQENPEVPQEEQEPQPGGQEDNANDSNHQEQDIPDEPEVPQQDQEEPQPEGHGDSANDGNHQEQDVPEEPEVPQQDQEPQPESQGDNANDGDHQEQDIPEEPEVPLQDQEEPQVEGHGDNANDGNQQEQDSREEPEVLQQDQEEPQAEGHGDKLNGEERQHADAGDAAYKRGPIILLAEPKKFLDPSKFNRN